MGTNSSDSCLQLLNRNFPSHGWRLFVTNMTARLDTVSWPVGPVLGIQLRSPAASRALDMAQSHAVMVQAVNLFGVSSPTFATGGFYLPPSFSSS